MVRRISTIMVIAAAVLPATSLAQRGSLYTCSYRVGLPRSPRSTIYTTNILPMTGSYQDIVKAWTDYVTKSYGPLNGSAECYSGEQPSIGQGKTMQLEIWGKHIETGWQYSTGMTAMPSKQGAIYGWCSSGDFGGEKTLYETPVFEIPLSDAKATTSPVEVTYVNYLISKKYNRYAFGQWYSKSVACSHSYVSREDAEASRVKAEAQAKAAGKAVVQTGWIYARNATTPASDAATNSH